MTLSENTLPSRLLSLDAALSDGLAKMFFGMPPERSTRPKSVLLRDLNARPDDVIRRKYYDHLSDAGLLDQGRGQGIRKACEPSVAACASAWSGLNTMMSASTFDSLGARHQSQVQIGHIWVGPSLDWAIGRKGITFLLNFEAFTNLWSVEARIGVSQNELDVGFEAGLTLGTTGTFAYGYRSCDWYLNRSGVHREIDDSLYMRVGPPTAGVVLILDRNFKNFSFKFDLKSSAFLQRWGFQPKLRFAVKDVQKFEAGLKEFLAAHQRQQGALENLRRLVETGDLSRGSCPRANHVDGHDMRPTKMVPSHPAIHAMHAMHRSPAASTASTLRERSGLEGRPINHSP